MINDKVFRFKILNIPFEEYETEPIQKNKSISIFGTVFCAGIQNVYETKTNRKKLIKAFYGKAACVGIAYVEPGDLLKLTREDGKGAFVPADLP